MNIYFLTSSNTTGNAKINIWGGKMQQWCLKQDRHVNYLEKHCLQIRLLWPSLSSLNAKKKSTAHLFCFGTPTISLFFFCFFHHQRQPNDSQPLSSIRTDFYPRGVRLRQQQQQQQQHMIQIITRCSAESLSRELWETSSGTWLVPGKKKKKKHPSWSKRSEPEPTLQPLNSKWGFQFNNVAVTLHPLEPCID